MKIRTCTRRRATVVAAGTAAALLVGAGTSVAFWTTTGAGDGTAEVGEGNTINSIAEFDVEGLLYPSTDSVGDLGLEITSSVNATLTSITQDTTSGRQVTVTDGGPNCTGEFVELDPVAVEIPLLAGEPLSQTIEDVVSMDFDAPSDCQGAKFTIPVILTGTETP